MYSASTPSNEVLVGTAAGIARLVRDGGTWQLAGHTLEDKHVGPILVEPESGLIFAGAYKDPHVFISSDDGKTWETHTLAEGVTDVYSIEAVPGVNNPRIYVGTEPARLFFSDDLGASWTERPALTQVPSTGRWTFPAPPHIAHTKHINYDKADPNTLYISIEQGGLLRSRDAGETFEVVQGMDDDVHRLVVDGGNWYVTGGDGVYASTNAGGSWEHRTTREHEIGGYPDQLVYLPSNPSRMFIASAEHSPGSWRESHNAGARISRSDDAGRTWNILTEGLPDRMQGNVEAMIIEETPSTCRLLAATTAGEVYASEDAGESWSIVVDGLAPISKAGHYRALTGATA